MGLHICEWTFFSCGQLVGANFHCLVLTSLSGFSCCGEWALGARASVVAAHRLTAVVQGLSCSTEFRIFLAQG